MHLYACIPYICMGKSISMHSWFNHPNPRTPTRAPQRVHPNVPPQCVHPNACTPTRAPQCPEGQLLSPWVLGSIVDYQSRPR